MKVHFCIHANNMFSSNWMLSLKKLLLCLFRFNLRKVLTLGMCLSALSVSFFYCSISISYNEEQIITGYPIDGAMGRSGGRQVRKLSDVCLHNNAIVARGILVTNIAFWDTLTASAPSILLVLLEPHYHNVQMA